MPAAPNTNPAITFIQSVYQSIRMECRRTSWKLRRPLVDYYNTTEIWQNLTTVLIRNQIIVLCMTVERSLWCSAPRCCFRTLRVGMYLNWNRSHRNTASATHTHTQIPQLYVSWCSGVGTRQRYSRCGGPCRICHKVHLPPQISLSCNSIPREFLAKCQHRTRSISARPFQELCTIDCPLPLLG